MSTSLAGSSPAHDVYDPLARFLHWLTAAVVLTMIPAGLVMARLDPGPTQNALFTLHESLGLTLWPFVVWRLIHRLRHPPPPLPADLPPSMALAARATHWFLYGALLVMPPLGLVGVYSFGATVNFWWLVVLPVPIGKDEALSEIVLAAHSWLGIAMAAAIAAHVVGALYHHFVRRDRVLLRMLGR